MKVFTFSMLLLFAGPEYTAVAADQGQSTLISIEQGKAISQFNMHYHRWISGIYEQWTGIEPPHPDMNLARYSRMDEYVSMFKLGRLALYPAADRLSKPSKYEPFARYLVQGTLDLMKWKESDFKPYRDLDALGKKIVARLVQEGLVPNYLVIAEPGETVKLEVIQK